MTFPNFYGHSLDRSLLTPGGWVIDVGCRDFLFARELLDLGARVLAIDPDPTVEVPEDLRQDQNLEFLRVALVGEKPQSTLNLAMHNSPIARHLVTDAMPAGNFPVVPVKAMTISDVLELLEVDRVDAVKLDCEGSEYGILSSWPGPVANQITVEFHEHTQSNPGGMETYGRIISHLGRWYDCYGFKASHQEGVETDNYWDVMFLGR